MTVVRRGACLVAVLLLFGCTEAKETAKGEFIPATGGQLTVATTLPAPGFWVGADVANIDGGFEWGIAMDIASRNNLELAIVDVPFADIVSGNLHGADVALSQVSITDARKKVVDFSSGYFTSQPAVVARKGRDLTDLATAREWQWAARESTTEADFINDVIRPDMSLELTASEQDAMQSVRSGAVDAALMDLPTALVLTRDDPDLATISRFDRTEQFGVVLPADSGNVETVDKDLAAMRADHTLTDLDNQWLAPAFGLDPNKLPVIQTR